MPEQGKSVVSRLGTGKGPVKPDDRTVWSAGNMKGDGLPVLVGKSVGVRR